MRWPQTGQANPSCSNVTLDTESEGAIVSLLEALDVLLDDLDCYHHRLRTIDPMTVGTPPHVEIPDGWTAAQAHAVLDFLRNTADAVWAGHETLVTEHAAAELAASKKWADDIPF
jgi:hypothetical protein